MPIAQYSKSANFSAWSIRGFLILKMNHFFVSPGSLYHFLSLFSYLFVCPNLRDYNTEKREMKKGKKKKKGKREKIEVAFTNLRDNDMATRQGFYSHVDYRKCPSLNV